MTAIQKRKSIQPGESRQATEDVDLVYETNRWTRLIFRNELEEGGAILDTVQAREEAVWQPFVRELFGRLYGVGCEPLEEARLGAEWAAQLHTEADAVPEWKDLEGRVRGDSYRAAYGAAVAGAVLAKHMPPELPEDDLAVLQAEADVLKDIMERNGGKKVSSKLLAKRAELQRRIAQAKQAAQNALQHVQQHNGFPMRSALRAAAAEAAGAVGALDDTLEALGAGDQASMAMRRQVTKRLTEQPQLRRIAEIAGRLQAQARAKQRTKVNRETEEVTDVEPGRDIARLIPSELGNLAHPDTTKLLYRKLLEGSALTYRLRGREHKQRGPLLFLIDTSGSMSGTRDEWAKASALAMLEVARIQKRAFGIGFFCVGVVHEFLVTDPRSVDPKQLLDTLSYFGGGGTDIAKAIDWAAKKITDQSWKPGEKADVIVVTDGDDYSDCVKAGKAINEAGATLYTIAIQCEPQPSLAKASAEVIKIRPADMDPKASGKLDTVFSV